MNEEIENFLERQKADVLNFYMRKLCSIKQFVGNGKISINKETTTFNSKSVMVNVIREDGETYVLESDYAVSNGIKTGDIDEDFLLHEEFIRSENHFYANCCILIVDGKYIIKFDKKSDFSELDFIPLEEQDVERFENPKFKILCLVNDIIGDEGSFYQKKDNGREFVIKRFDKDQDPIRLLCSNELKFQLSNGKDPRDLLDHYIGIFKDDNGKEYLRIFDKINITYQSYHKRDGLYFIINQIMKNPYKHSFLKISFDNKDYIRVK